MKERRDQYVQGIVSIHKYGVWVHFVTAKRGFFPSNQDGIDTCVYELTGYHDCYRCITLLNKYYGHQCYRICFAHEELQHGNDDIRSGNRFDLVDSFTREEIEVEFILDCLFAESQIQKTPDALNIMANSVLNFICKIG